MTVHVIGAGLAGLSAAVHLSGKGRRVAVHEAAAQPGGRCRSFHDPALGRRIDNGNHLLLSGNVHAMDYLRTIGSLETLTAPPGEGFPFLDLRQGRRWTVKAGALRDIPGVTLLDVLAGLKLAVAGPGTTVARAFDITRPAFRNLWEPLCVSVLNGHPDVAAARLLWPVLKQTVGRGRAASRPLLAREGLSESFIDPALDYLRGRGAKIHCNRRLRGLTWDGDRAAALLFQGEELPLSPGDSVIVATAPEVAAKLLPGLVVPSRFNAIVNGHFLLPGHPLDGGILGLVGGTAQWLFARGDVVSVTVSAADGLCGLPSGEIAATLWREILQALDLPPREPGPCRIIKERRATFAQTPEQLHLRPGPRTRWRNVLLAGDWTATGLPATVEGAVLSGRRAARAALRR